MILKNGIKNLRRGKAVFTPSKFPTTLKLFTTPQLGEVDQTIADPAKGRIKFQRSLWSAQIWHLSSQFSYFKPLSPGELVWVLGRVGLTLLVQPYDLSSHAPIELAPNLTFQNLPAPPQKPAFAETGRPRL